MVAIHHVVPLACQSAFSPQKAHSLARCICCEFGGVPLKIYQETSLLPKCFLAQHLFKYDGAIPGMRPKPPTRGGYSVNDDGGDDGNDLAVA